MEENNMEEYQEEIEDYQDEAEEQQDAYEDAQENQRRMGYDYPKPKESESLFNLFHKVLGLADSSKVGNLDKSELGLVNISVRDCQNISLLSEKLGHPHFGDFFAKRSQITLTTSASKGGWFTDLFVTQKKSQIKTSSVETKPMQDDLRRNKKWKSPGQ